MSASSKNDSGLMSSAGLVRYFDSEDKNSIKINPKTVFAVSTLMGVVVMLLQAGV
jgi:preprotein translocase subunit Sec61beta